MGSIRREIIAPSLPPIPGTPDGTAPELPTGPVTGVIVPVPMGPSLTSVPDPPPLADEQPGPFCFGLDAVFCNQLERLPFFGDQTKRFCILFANTLCIILAILLLTLILALAIFALVEF